MASKNEFRQCPQVCISKWVGRWAGFTFSQSRSSGSSVDEIDPFLELVVSLNLQEMNGSHPFFHLVLLEVPFLERESFLQEKEGH